MNWPKMDLAADHILLSQGNQSLENHTLAFLDLYHLVHYNDDCLCVVFRTSLNTETRVHLPSAEPLGTFKKYVERILLHNGSPFTIF